MNVFGVQSTTGTPRMRFEILLELKPEALARSAAADESLVEIGQRLSNALTIDTDDVIVVTSSQTVYKEPPSPPNPADILEDMRAVFKRIAPKKEGWEGDEHV
jgi:hypothetical protein